MYGTIESRWQVEGDRFKLEVAVPPGSTATTYVPAPSLESVTEGGKPAARAGGVRPVGMEAGRAVFQLPIRAVLFRFGNGCGAVTMIQSSPFKRPGYAAVARCPRTSCNRPQRIRR